VRLAVDTCPMLKSIESVAGVVIPSGMKMNNQDLHPVALLPDQDADEAFCKRHNFEMNQVNPILKWDGGAYSTNDKYSVYYCPACLNMQAVIGEKKTEHEYDGQRVYKAHLIHMFKMWDDGEAPGDWFQYVGEAHELDEGYFVDFEEVPDE